MPTQSTNTIYRDGSRSLYLNQPAPSNFTYCSICRGWQHPDWHKIGWRNERWDAGDYRAALTYAQPPNET